jgi:type VI secretion system secreted protein Hcp
MLDPMVNATWNRWTSVKDGAFNRRREWKAATVRFWEETMNRIVFLVTAIAVLITPFALGKDVFLSIKGSKQGAFRGEGQAAASGRIACAGFEYNIKAPRDVATGQASGKRQHGTIRIIKEWGAASPMFHNALISNDTLSNLEFLFTKTDQRTGQAVVFQKITLSTATVIDIRQYVGAFTDPAITAKHASAKEAIYFEEITLNFDQGLIMTNVESGVSTAPGGAAEAGKILGTRPGRIPPPGPKTK